MPVSNALRSVRAAKVESLTSSGLVLEGGQAVPVSLWWVLRHRPEVGGYFIVDGDEETYAPAHIFESNGKGFKRAGGAS